jgi:magnesium transporter
MSRYKRLKKRLSAKLNRKQHQPGLPPGTLMYLGEQPRDADIKLKQIEYTESMLRSREISLETLSKTQDKETKDWIIVSGIHNAEIIKKIGKIFDVHLLDLEDILTPDHPPKIEIYEDYIFITLKYLDSSTFNDESKAEQISILFGYNFLIMFRENGLEEFTPILERIKGNHNNRYLELNTDYLCYAILDFIVDNYFVVLDKIDDEIEAIDTKLDHEDCSTRVLDEIRRLKRETINLKKYFKPVREIVDQ